MYSFPPASAIHASLHAAGSARSPSAGSQPYHARVRDSHLPDGWDVQGPVRAEIFMIWLNADRLELTGPDGARPWVLQLADGEHPVEAVERIVSGLVGPPVLVHSTSWRHQQGRLILTYVAAVTVAEQLSGYLTDDPVARADLARGDAIGPPTDIDVPQVIEHAFRHLSWLVKDDAVVGEALADWVAFLDRYEPEPFRAFGSAAG